MYGTFLDKAREDYELIENCYNQLLEIVAKNEALEKDEYIQRKLAKLKKSLARFDAAIKSYTKKVVKCDKQRNG